MKAAVIIIVILIILGVGAYFVLNKTQTASNLGSTQTQSMSQNGKPTSGMGHRFGNMPQGSTPIFGQVTAVNGNQITLQSKGRDGSGNTITVDLISSTKYQNGTQSSIATGTRIGGYGVKNSDGTVNAQQVMINPTFQGHGKNGTQANNQ